MPEPVTPKTPETQPEDALPIDLLALPVEIDDWTLSLQAGASGTENCLLNSRRIQMQDGHGPTRINLMLHSEGLYVQSDSNIDLTYADTGLRIGDQPFELETLSNPTTLIFTRQRDDMIEALQYAPTVRVTLGFWPTWPVTQAYSGTLPTKGFARAWQAWQQCTKMLNIR